MAITRMPKALATRAISDPITPRPRMPTVLPFNSVGHWPRERRVPGTDHSHSRSGLCFKSDMKPAAERQHHSQRILGPGRIEAGLGAGQGDGTLHHLRKHVAFHAARAGVDPAEFPGHPQQPGVESPHKGHLGLGEGLHQEVAVLAGNHPDAVHAAFDLFQALGEPTDHRQERGFFRHVNLLAPQAAPSARALPGRSSPIPGPRLREAGGSRRSA